MLGVGLWPGVEVVMYLLVIGGRERKGKRERGKSGMLEKRSRESTNFEREKKTEKISHLAKSSSICTSRALSNFEPVSP